VRPETWRGAGLTGGDAVEGVVGADGVEIDAGEVDGAAVAAGAGGEEEAQEAAPVAAVRFEERRRRVHGAAVEGFGAAEELGVRSAQRKQMEGRRKIITEETERRGLVWCGEQGRTHEPKPSNGNDGGRGVGPAAVVLILKCFCGNCLNAATSWEK
jgi:hypothetical protein